MKSASALDLLSAKIWEFFNKIDLTPIPVFVKLKAYNLFQSLPERIHFTISIIPANSKPKFAMLAIGMMENWNTGILGLYSTAPTKLQPTNTGDEVKLRSPCTDAFSIYNTVQIIPKNLNPDIVVIRFSTLFQYSLQAA